MDELKAIITIANKIYHNGNDWGVYKVEINEIKSGKPYNNKIITITGNMPELMEDTQYLIVGKEIEDKRFGTQYKLKSIINLIQVDEKDEKGKKKYLNKLFTPNQVAAMYEALQDPFETLKSENAIQLVQVKGCGMPTAIRWLKKFKDNYSYSKIYIELEEYELTHNMVQRLMEKYGNPDLVIAKVKNNPYTLSEVPGIGWKKADEIARKGGIEPYCPERIQSFITYYLENCGNDGRSYISPEELMDAIVEAIGDNVPDLAVTVSIQQLGDVLWYNKEKSKIGLMKYRKLEEGIAQELKRLIDAENQFAYDNWEEIIKQIEEEQKWEYTEEQKVGIKDALTNNVIVVEGLAGTGKTTLVHAIVEILNKYSRAMCALSGRAAARLAEVTGDQGFTIHRLLGFPNLQPDDPHKFTYNEENPLCYEIIVNDEISMNGGRLFYNLLKAIPSGSKLILLGDIGQLAPIGECNIAYDLVKSKYIPTVSLTQIHRQAQKSAIITDSIRMRKGISIVPKDYVGIQTKGELQDFTMDIYSDVTNTYYKVLQWFSTELQKVDSILDLQIVVPLRIRGNSSVYSINNATQELYNPKSKDKKEITCFMSGQPYVLREGDKVINRKNNYNVCSEDGTVFGLFNGDIGVIHSITEDGNYMEVDFTGKGRYFIDKDVINHIELAYAITCHSFQGSQAERVIVALDYSSYVQLSREWLYTAITRAKKHTVLIAQNSALHYAINHEGLINKTTHLQQCLEDLYNPRLIF